MMFTLGQVIVVVAAVITAPLIVKTAFRIAIYPFNRDEDMRDDLITVLIIWLVVFITLYFTK